MKKKHVFIAILAFLIVSALAAAWVWYNNFRTTDDSLANVKKKGVLVVGSNLPFGVMEFFDVNNQPAGIDVDIAKEIASRLDIRLEFNNYEWDELFSKTKSGEIDLAISGITITPTRQEEVLFSEPYFNGGQVIVVRSDNQNIKGVIDLMDKKIAVQKDTTGYIEAKKYTAESSIFSYLNFDGSDGGILDGLKSGESDAIIVDYIQALEMIKTNSGLKIVGVPFTKENYGIIVKKGNSSLLSKINSILKDMEDDGTLQKIEVKWIKL